MTLNAHVQFFGSGFDADWYNYPKGNRVKLQRRAAKASGSWTRVVTARLQRRGQVHFAIRATKRFQYRVTSSGTSRSCPLVGKVLTK